ncbi:sodium-dependent phosphate transporter 1-B isoform X2 [Hyalella azteca]|uniref:Phosphate transporter n=1 Tax=Hyalella azteca TaxID=294128 RepID=A0A8B7P246_HYAAZ|nr:sodium-dependent phosphate transporter 1-B isoform X2 [Hyalella azteca]
MGGAKLGILMLVLGVSFTVVPAFDITEMVPTSTFSPFTTTTEHSLSIWHSQTLWIIIVGFFLAFTLAFGVGANDVANVFGTSVGAKVVTLRQACIIATFAEIAGAVLLGYKVSDTVRKGILDVELYNNTEKELMLGSLAALGGSSIWNLVATFFSLPISGTHTIVGATVGFSLCARGLNGVNWATFGKIVASWFVSPIMSGFISAIIFLIVRTFILNKADPITPGLKSLPFFYGFTVLVNVFSVVHDGPQMLLFDRIPWWGALIVSLSVGAIVGLLVQFLVVPRQRASIQEIIDARNRKPSFTFDSTDNSRSGTPPQELAIVENGIITPTSFPFDSQKKSKESLATPSEHSEQSEEGSGLLSDKPMASKNDQSVAALLASNASQLPLVEGSNGSKESELDQPPKEDQESESPEVGKLFSFLQIMTATFGSFAHGGNDVSNAIGPLIALWAIYTEGSVAQKSEPPIYILLYGGLGISVGLWVWGRRVIKTIGEDLTKVTPSSGFSIEVGSAFTVLLASKIGLPISTTHCKVGSVVFVGWTKSTKRGVDWGLFRNIVIAWIVTVPLTAAISALLMLMLQTIFL